jgi:NADH:ubiquinone oxidoreductase subunit C
MSKSMLCQASQLLDIVCVELAKRVEHFTLTYVLLSLKQGYRHFVRHTCGLFGVVSLQELFKSACWLEREVWDMFGVAFTGALDLRRILTDYGFQGHPSQEKFSFIRLY